MEVNIQIERRSKTLDQGDRARLGHLVGMARFLDQVRGNDAVNDAQHPPHDLGPAGKQETQLKREAQLYESNKVSSFVVHKYLFLLVPKLYCIY
ncbi:hypothetical protein F969_01163 [Acinetobacter variabilis]|uniref:Uncharacterized protein n=1 Tax=Acinetobacter variabilis TaxID=70346 RepID=N8VIL8_9GAMM|nr:hypothetical protein F969_01163 [Acinetobacter variabilis]